MTKASLRNRHRDLFSSVKLYHIVFRMLSYEHYKQPVRAFVLDMFDLQLTAEILAEFRVLDLQADIIGQTVNETVQQIGLPDSVTDQHAIAADESNMQPLSNTQEPEVQALQQKTSARVVAGFSWHRNHATGNIE